MAASISMGDVQVGAATSRRRDDDGKPFRIVVLGDFSGARDDAVALAKRKTHQVDRDNFDEVMQRLDVRWHGAPPDADGQSQMIHFREMEDFHPDSLYQKLEFFGHLENIKRQLLSEKGFDKGVAALRRLAPDVTVEPQPEEATEAPAPLPPDTAPDNLLDAALEATTRGESSHVDPFQQAIARLVAPYSQPAADPRREELAGSVDEIAGESMRLVLRGRKFQALESAWRSVWSLVRSLETDALLQIHLLDVSQEELAADLNGRQNVAETDAYKLLVESTRETSGAAPWSVIVGLHSFGPSDDDAGCLSKMGQVAQAAGAPFLAAAKGELVGCPRPSETPEVDDWAPAPASDAWQTLKASPQAAWIALFWPRILLRLPYGQKTSPCEAFSFEEAPDGKISHDGFLWGSPAVAAARLLGDAFQQVGWQMRPGMAAQIDGLPLYIDKDEYGDSVARPCGELLLTDRAAERAAQCGVAAVLSVKGSDSIRIPRFRSLQGEPARGPWSE